MENKELKTAETLQGTVYIEMGQPDDISQLDRQIVLNTLKYREFIAYMSDDARRTDDELAAINQYRQKMNLRE